MLALISCDSVMVNNSLHRTIPHTPLGAGEAPWSAESCRLRTQNREAEPFSPEISLQYPSVPRDKGKILKGSSTIFKNRQKWCLELRGNELITDKNSDVQRWQKGTEVVLYSSDGTLDKDENE